jgi:hypothetical protein
VVNFDGGKIARCSACAHRFPNEHPPAIADLRRDKVGTWSIWRIERRTAASHKALFAAGRLSEMGGGVYSDTGDRRVLKLFTEKTGRIQCRRCKRRLPYGRNELIRRAALSDGPDFLA